MYQQILDVKRARQTTISGRNLALEAESDRSRLIFSAPFRRLQQKAQVFSLEPNAAVRSRLTHSIEVAQIGRIISGHITDHLLRERAITADQAQAFTVFVEVACLMHDLGNPPFGHFGEAAIIEWFEKSGLKILRASLKASGQSVFNNQLAERVLADFVEFDGNCQGLRIVSLLQWNDDPHGLNLTFTTLAAYLKYIRSPAFRAAQRGKGFKKKAGFFATEEQLVHDVWRYFDIDPSDPRRFPLAYVMEAADDIAYCISDLEDSIEKGLLDQDFVFEELKTKWDAACTPDLHEGQTVTDLLHEAAISRNNDGLTFTRFRTRLSQFLTRSASTAYIANHDQILDGTHETLISENSAAGVILNLLKTFCRINVYQQQAVQLTELGGLSAIRGLLEHFGILLECSEDRFTKALQQKSKDGDGRRILVERKILSLFPEKHLQAYRHGVDRLRNQNHGRLEAEWLLRAHLITDFISGMTDDFALTTYQKLSGIQVSSS